MKLLVIAPHPDDEVLGCGGTLAKRAAAGNEITLCIVTKAYKPDWSSEFLRERPKEIKASCRALGIKKVVPLDYPTVKLDTVPQRELNASLREVVEDASPCEVYIPHGGDLNADHRIVFKAALVATRPLKKRTHRILAYETLSETEWGRPLRQFHPNVYVDISKTFGAKLRAMRAYSSELRPFPHPRSVKAIDALATLRGSECGCERAEAFSLIRQVEAD